MRERGTQSCRTTSFSFFSAASSRRASMNAVIGGSTKRKITTGSTVSTVHPASTPISHFFSELKRVGASLLDCFACRIPSHHSAHEVHGLLEPQAMERLRGVRRAPARLAHHQQLFV